MEIVEALYYKVDLNKAIRRLRTWERVFGEKEELLNTLPEFLASKIGKIWLRSPQGQSFVLWQGS
jgi:hypothetical protein